MSWTIPNILTVARLLAAPGVALSYILLASPWADIVALSLFVVASLTDYLDGYLARKWNQISAFGRMLDPIADKVMVVIALAVLIGLTSGEIMLMIPVVVILFREVFVSGLREFLGARAGTLAVTKLAKWKTTVQMVAIAVLLSVRIPEYLFAVQSMAMENDQIIAILDGRADDIMNLRLKYALYVWTTNIGTVLLWIAAILTLVTGWDYFRKSLPFLQDDK